MYTSYDAYLTDGLLYISGHYAEKYVGGHTSVGIYDYMTYLVGSEPGDSLGAEGFEAPSLGYTTLHDYFPKVVCFMNGDTARYSDYIDVHDAWSRAGLWLDGRDISVLGTYESAARTAAGAVGLWQPPQLVHVATGMLPGGHILTDQVEIDGRFKPAVASFLLEDGATERVFVFYRPPDSLERRDWRILYIFQDRPTSLGDYETPSWRGPYEVPGALTAYGPTATSSDDIVVVAWNHRNPSGLAGGVQGAYIKFDTSSAPVGGFWQDLPDTGSQRIAVGTPSIVYWSPKGYRVDCGGLSLTGITPYPFESLGPYGDTFADCYEMSEDPGAGSTPPSLIPGADSFIMYEQMREMLNTEEARATPAVYDPVAPRRTDAYMNSSFRMHLRPQTTDQSSEVDIISALPGQVGEHWSWLQESSNPLAHAHAEFRLDFETDENGERSYHTLSTHFEIEWLALAFRTPGNSIYVTDWSDDRSTSMLEPVATSVMPVDPSLAEVDTQEYIGPTPLGAWFAERSLLYVYYVDDSADNGSKDNLAYRYAETFTDAGQLDGEAFEFPEFVNRITDHRVLDPESGVGHKIDFKFARTMYSPSVATKGNLMYLFVVGREMSADNYFVEDPADTIWNSSTDRFANLIRFGVVRPEGYEHLDPDPNPGMLTWHGERMVLLPRTNVGWVNLDETEHWADDDPTVQYPLLFGSGAGFFSKLRREFHYFFFTGELPHAMLTLRRSLNP